ncbi:endopeptidase La [Leptospira sp. GIMC2001]|uniref:endopeptidase La n=1 Tax=Leptospira sp. GIMC2001 TaxID=1513297 RepID=UPI00234B10D7|nr:endopeptidase La [Leptospira sp. GIMC2001]WCL50393.1 endopeptidase La [Leptospira sp. GIMC2001]
MSAQDTNSSEIPGNLIQIEDFLPHETFLLPLKSRPVFPGIITPLVVPMGRFVASVEEAILKDRFLGLVLLKKDDSPEDSENNMFETGIVSRIIKKINLPDGGVNILVNTIRRFEISKITQHNPFLMANLSYPEEGLGTSKNAIKAMMRSLVILTKELAQNNPLFTEDMKLTMMNVDEPGKMADFVCSILNLEKEEYQSVIESFRIGDRLEKVLLYLKKEIELVHLQRKIQDQINDKIDKQQRQYFLREQMKAIQTELGLDQERSDRKYNKLIERLKALKLDEQIIEETQREVEKFHSTDPHSADYNVLRNYLDTLEALPWEASPVRNIDITKARRILDRDHYKLDDVKERILEFLAVHKLNPKGRGIILCLVGPPGVGKTSIARSVAEAAGRKFFRFSVGGMRDEAEIKGHRRTYVGAMPGKIINALRITKEKDPVILLDELDKMSVGFQGDPASALLEVLDPEQNSSFRDHYLDMPFDLSGVFFIATANTSDTIPRVLLDRMEIINLSGYITDEKVQIFKKYLWTRSLDRNGLKDKKIELDNKSIVPFINSYSRESGLRGLEKMTDKIVRKLALKSLEGKKIPKTISDKDIKELLGSPPFVDDRMIYPQVPGTALGLAWTSIGGTTLLIESVFVKGDGKIFLTGQLGKMMEESANIALSYIKNYVKDGTVFQDKSIHLHVPDGATPKDGPSAGITMATTILSLAINRVVKKGFAMTGEITLTGEVLAIGGLREKIVAAKRVGVKNIILPKDNLSNLEEVPEYVKKGLKFHLVSKFPEVAELLLGKI